MASVLRFASSVASASSHAGTSMRFASSSRIRSASTVGFMASRHTKRVLFYLGSFARRNGFGKRMEAFLVDTPIVQPWLNQPHAGRGFKTHPFDAGFVRAAQGRVLLALPAGRLWSPEFIEGRFGWIGVCGNRCVSILRCAARTAGVRLAGGAERQRWGCERGWLPSG